MGGGAVSERPARSLGTTARTRRGAGWERVRGAWRWENSLQFGLAGTKGHTEQPYCWPGWEPPPLHPWESELQPLCIRKVRWPSPSPAFPLHLEVPTYTEPGGLGGGPAAELRASHAFGPRDPGSAPRAYTLMATCQPSSAWQGHGRRAAPARVPGPHPGSRGQRRSLRGEC